MKYITFSNVFSFLVVITLAIMASIVSTHTDSGYNGPYIRNTPELVVEFPDLLVEGKDGEMGAFFDNQDFKYETAASFLNTMIVDCIIPPAERGLTVKEANESDIGSLSILMRQIKQQNIEKSKKDDMVKFISEFIEDIRKRK